MQYFEMDSDAVLAALKTGRGGLSAEEALSRLGQYGRNELVERRKRSAFGMLLGQFTDFLILVLIAAAVVSGLIGELSDTIAILVIVILNAVLGFVQEYRAEAAMAALKKMAAASATVVRAGARQAAAAAEIVPGDIVVLDAGRIVPADMRILEAVRLSVEEAALTGESQAIEKQAAAIGNATALGDRRNMLYKGTFITYGRGVGVVTATGMQTELGKIAALLQAEAEVKTPLQKRLAAFGRNLAFVILGICAIIFTAGLLRGEDPVAVFLVAVSLAVAAIPEALPAVVTISLALGARKMVKLHALIRKLPSVETLGSVTYICSDKTGTLTQNRMTVEEVWCDGKRLPQGEGRRARDEGEPRIPYSASPTPQSLLFTAFAISNDACVEADGTIAGDPTEAALLAAAQQNGFDKKMLEAASPRVAELPFDSDRKLMTTVHRPSLILQHPALPAGNYISFTKGAVEMLLPKCSGMLTGEGRRPVDPAAVQTANDRLAASGLRVLAVGMRSWSELPEHLSHEQAENDVVLLGLVGMVDPPREEARHAVALCKTAGIVPVMITGDHPVTALVIARRVGILQAPGDGGLITGAELAGLPLAEFEKKVESIRVYARVAPEQKLTIVKALQGRGHFVAMTGDGVNDAPALKAADIGVAMGMTGTDVAKEASSMMLLDDNFSSIVQAVREGRRIYDNIRKFVKYLLSTNSGEIWTLFLAPLIGLPIPLQPIHILWINLATDGLPALALSLEPAERGIMERPPRNPRESIFAQGLGIHAIWVGLLMAAVTLSIQAWAIHIGDAHWQTMVFTVLCFLQLGHALAIRSERESLFTQGVLSNRFLFAAVVCMVVLQLLTVYVPALNPVFKTQPLSVSELLVVLALSLTVFTGVEIEKAVKRRQKKS